MPRARKHGIVQQGNTTTLYGNNANAFLAQAWVSNCFDNRKCSKFINEQEDGPYRDALIDHAKRLNMVEDARKKGRVKAIPMNRKA